MKQSSIQISHGECYLLCVSAVRYALGRRTYIVGSTCETVTRLAKHLTTDELAVIIRDIDEHAKFGYGDKCDENQWMGLKRGLTELVETKK